MRESREAMQAKLQAEADVVGQLLAVALLRQQNHA